MKGVGSWLQRGWGRSRGSQQKQQQEQQVQEQQEQEQQEQQVQDVTNVAAERKNEEARQHSGVPEGMLHLDQQARSPLRTPKMLSSICHPSRFCHISVAPF